MNTLQLKVAFPQKVWFNSSHSHIWVPVSRDCEILKSVTTDAITELLLKDNIMFRAAGIGVA